MAIELMIKIHKGLNNTACVRLLCASVLSFEQNIQ